MNDDVHALVGPYLLNALDDADRAECEKHLARCAACQDEVAALADVPRTLGEGVAVAPPAGLRTRVLAGVAATAQEGATREERSPKAARRWPAIALAAASALVLAGLGVVAVSSQNARQEQLALEHDVMMVATAPDAHVMELELGAAHLVMSDSMSSVAAMGQFAPMPAAGMEYQLWLVMADGSVAPGPTFEPNREGDFMTVMTADLEGVAGFAVTQEPEGGSQQPTSTPVASLEL